MALSKQVINENGVITNYHKVNNVSLDDNILFCNLESYVSKEYREKERSASSQVFDFEITTEEEESMGIRQLCYTKIKSLEEWSDAVDC